MRRFLKILGTLILIIILIAGSGLIYLNSAYPKVDKPKDIHIEITPQRLERGEYLVNNAMGCLGCHSERDWSKYSGPVIPGTDGKGGMYFDKELVGVPGIVYSKNITPFAIGNWTDGEVLRALTAGVNKKGEALFPLMPYEHYRNVSEEDLYSVIAYLRSLKPITNVVQSRKLDFPVNFIVKTIPVNAPEKFVIMPDSTDSIEYGKYIINRATCFHCHTAVDDKGQPLPGMDFAGGFKFNFPNGSTVTSPNITPDKETGIGLLTKEDFLNKFRFYRTESARNIHVDVGGHQTVMPWTELAGMTDGDLSAIYTYLKSIKPVHHPIDKFAEGH